MDKNEIKIIAEIGWNHMGDMDLASKMIISAAENGADICKFQTWSESKLKAGPWDHDGRREIYKKAELSKDDHHYLKQVCENNDVQFMTSIFDIGDLDFLNSLNMNIIKIPSHEVYNLELIMAVAEKFDTIIISTGAAKWDEVVKISEKVNPEKIVLLHCVSTYPCPMDNINFPRMEKLKEYSKTIGYSGHYSGIDDAIIAICKGASFVEKHFTIDQNLPGRDNKFAILPEQMRAISDFRDDYKKMYKDLGLDLQESEMDTYQNYRGRWSKVGE